MISLKSEHEVALMRKAGSIVGKVFEKLEKELKAGLTTKGIDSLAAGFIKSLGGEPAFLGYKGFPGHICASINSEVVHGIPKKERMLKNGDILSLDIGVKREGYFADAAATFAIGSISEKARDLMEATEESLYLGIDEARAGNRLSNVGHAIQEHVELNGFNAVRVFVGHGIGSSIHEEPEIPNFGTPGKGIRLEPGMTLAIEPMVNQGTHEINILDDGWTAVTSDGKLSAHFEHTILITEGKPEILTLWQKKNQ